MAQKILLDVVDTRVSVRLFKQAPIPVEVLRQIVEAGIRAPTAGGGEEWFFIIVLSEEKRRKIHELLVEAHILYAEKVLRNPLPPEKVEKWRKSVLEGMYYAPAYIASYIDLRNPLYRDECRELERLWAHQSLASAFENMMLVAWSRGIGSVWLGVPLLLREEFDRVLQPPKGLELAGILALGYPARSIRPRTRHKEFERVCKIT